MHSLNPAAVIPVRTPEKVACRRQRNAEVATHDQIGAGSRTHKRNQIHAAAAKSFLEKILPCREVNNSPAGSERSVNCALNVCSIISRSVSSCAIRLDIENGTALIQK